MSSSEHPTRPVAPAGAAPLGSRRRRSPVCVALSSLALVLAALPACNAVLGIDDATLCSDGRCDGGVADLSEDVAPNLPGSGAGNGDDAGALSPGGELIPPIQGVNTAGAGDGSAGAPPAQPEPGSGGSNGSGGSSNSGPGGSGNSGGSNSGPGGGDDEPPPP